jgi:hypothetical protein
MNQGLFFELGKAIQTIKICLMTDPVETRNIIQGHLSELYDVEKDVNEEEGESETDEEIISPIMHRGNGEAEANMIEEHEKVFDIYEEFKGFEGVHVGNCEKQSYF